MSPPTSSPALGGILWSLAATAFFVLLNGFFVAAEFSLVKVRPGRIRTLAEEGSAPARVVQRVLERLNLYLSSCQLGITLASLVLGWLAEPAVASLLVMGAGAVGLGRPDSTLVHGAALAVALTVVTILHMTFGEQAPKIWAIRKAESTAMATAYPLRLFTLMFRPFIWLVNLLSNLLLRLAGMKEEGHTEEPLTAEELAALLEASAQAGHISPRQHHYADNVLRIKELQIRHIMVPASEVIRLSPTMPAADTLSTIRQSTHSRFPLCHTDLDSTLGIIHAKDVLAALADDGEIDLRGMARPALRLPADYALGRMIFEMQRARVKCGLVLDAHGAVAGCAFMEDAVEEIVGPIHDEFDDEQSEAGR